jgi:hypothetical protein
VKKTVCYEITAKCSEITTSIVKKPRCRVKKPNVQGYFIAKMRKLDKNNQKYKSKFNVLFNYLGATHINSKLKCNIK